jgi:prefoldin beta subunit
MDNISPKIQNQLQMLQQMQQQMQAVLQQKSQYEMAVKEAKRAVEELNDTKEGAEVYMTVGSVIVQKDRDTVLSTLNEKIETLDIRLKSLEKQEKALSSKFEQLSAQVREALEKKPPQAQ